MNFHTTEQVVAGAVVKSVVEMMEEEKVKDVMVEERKVEDVVVEVMLVEEGKEAAEAEDLVVMAA